MGYEAEKSPTLRAGVVPAAVTMWENHSQDTRYTDPLDTAPTVSSTYGTGGNNQPFVVGDTPKTMKIRSGCEGGGKGILVQESKSATLACTNDQTVFVPKAYGISSFCSNAMLSDNPHAGIYEAETSRTLDCSGGSPTANQGGVCVVEREACFDIRQTSDGTKVSRHHCYETETARSLGTSHPDPAGNHGGVAVVEKAYSIQGNMIGRDDKNGPQGDGINEDVSFTLNATDHHAVYAMTTGCFTHVEEEKTPTLMARDYKDPTTVAPVPGTEPQYTVRRLTPVECARLQGFSDWWCADLGTEKPTDEELYFWYKVFETHRLVTNPKVKPKTSKQIAKWLKDPHSDSAEYKMWGNGVALPCVAFVLSGIVYYSQLPAE